MESWEIESDEMERNIDEAEKLLECFGWTNFPESGVRSPEFRVESQARVCPESACVDCVVVWHMGKEYHGGTARTSSMCAQRDLLEGENIEERERPDAE